MDLTKAVCSDRQFASKRTSRAREGVARLVLVVALGGALSFGGFDVAHAPAASAASISLKDYAKYQLEDKSEFKCLDKLWTLESNWRVDAYNKHGAYGIPQIMNPLLKDKTGYQQIDLGLKYLNHRYSSICQALRLWNKRAGYDWIGGWY